MVTTVNTGLRKFTEGSNHALQHYYDLESATIERVEGHEGMPHVVDYLTAVGLGLKIGHSEFGGFGERSSLSSASTGDDLWNGVSATLPIPSEAGEQLTVVSTSASDTAAGSNVRTVDIHGLDANGVECSETVIMTGTTPVNTTRTNWRFVQSMHTQSIGTAYAASAGLITCYKTGSATTIYNQISVGGNTSLNSARMVPLGKTFLMSTIHVSACSNKPISIRLRANSTVENVWCNFFQYKDTFFLIDSAMSKTYEIPLKFPALCIIKATAFSATAGGDASVSYGGWYE